MKILVEKILPNPYRNMEKYPINRDKVESLKASIEETGVWQTIVAREHPDKKGFFQIAFGHHRLQAIKELKIKEIKISVEEMTDIQMLKRMANENMNDWGITTGVIVETVLSVKNYLENELSKYESWEDITSNKFIRCLFETKTGFTECKTKGIGQTIILKFLGKPWKQWQVQQALEILNKEKIDKDAIEKIEQIAEAKDTAKIMNDYKVDKEDQEDIVDEVNEELEKVKQKTGKKKASRKKRKEITEQVVKNKGYEKELNRREIAKEEGRRNEIIRNCLESIQVVNGSLIEVIDNWESFNENNKRKLLRQIELMLDVLKEHKQIIGI
jgi:hypothetical protein